MLSSKLTFAFFITITFQNFFKLIQMLWKTDAIIKKFLSNQTFNSMTLSFSNSHRNRIVHHLLNKMSSNAIASIEKVSKRTMKKIRANLNTFDAFVVLKMSKLNRFETMISAMKSALREYLKTKPWTYLKKMIEYLFDEFEIFVSISVISRTLKNMKISRKVLKKEALEWSQLCRNFYQLQISEHYTRSINSHIITSYL